MAEVLRESVGFVQRVLNFFHREAEVSENMYEINIPMNVFHRTELICNYIKIEKGYDFGVENFLMLLYLDFIRQSVKSYNPKKIYKQITTEYYEKKSFLIAAGEEAYEVTKTNYKPCKLDIYIDKENMLAGKLILDELYDLYRVRISFNRLLESLWIGFIESYKKGENNKAYTTIVKLLKECFDNK